MLIVDDNGDFLRLLSLELSDVTNWRVSAAQSAVEAKAAADAQPINFALLDLILPDGNGIDLGVSLIEKQPGMHIAIMTGGELTTAEENECRKYRFDIVNKPFLPQQIVSLVRERSMRVSQTA